MLVCPDFTPGISCRRKKGHGLGATRGEATGSWAPTCLRGAEQGQGAVQQRGLWGSRGQAGLVGMERKATGSFSPRLLIFELINFTEGWRKLNLKNNLSPALDFKPFGALIRSLCFYYYYF